MKTVETDPRLPGWLNAVLNAWPLAIDRDSIRTIAWAWGPWGVAKCPDTSLFWNGYVFVRLSLPFWVGLHVRLPRASRYFQCGLGWKLNGRAAVTFRFQTDATAARGVLGPNLGQATGMEWGPK